MIYAQFFQRAVTDPSKLVEACGDRAVVILDGRSPSRHQRWANEECHKRGYVAFQLMKGDSFTTARSIGALTYLF